MKTLKEHLAYARSKKKADWNKHIDYKAMALKSLEVRRLKKQNKDNQV